MEVRVLAVAAECFPYAKVGGLADVLGALPRALRDLGAEARVLLPGYPKVLERLGPTRPLRGWADLMGGGPARLVVGVDTDGAPLYALDAPGFFGHLDHPYEERPDLAHRFAALAWAGAAVAREGDGQGWRPTLLHAHDWPAGLAPAYLAFGAGPRIPSVMTIHNLAYPGAFDPALVPALGLPWEAYAMEGAEFHGRLSFLKAGLHFATALTTVSPTYAREIQTPGEGWGLEGLLHHRRGRLTGILNGVDTGIWDPATSPHLQANYDLERLHRRGQNRAPLQVEMGLAQDPEAPLLGVVSRLETIKGLDLLLGRLESWVAAGGQAAILGTGDPQLEAAFQQAALAHPGRVAVALRHDEGMAHRIFAGVDVVAVPSRSEPCGLTQLYAQRFGALPLVRRTGGLADTVDDTPGRATGFLFDAPTGAALGAALQRVQDTFKDRAAWEERQRRGMGKDMGWGPSARKYLELFERLQGEVS